MSRATRGVAAVCAALWLLPVVGFFVMSVTAWTADPDDVAADPHGYVGLFGLLIAVPALAFAACAVTVLWKVARDRRGAGDWLLVVGILAAAGAVVMLPGLFATTFVAQQGPGTPGIDSSGPSMLLMGGEAAVVVLAVVTLVVALRVRREERLLQPLAPAWPPVAPGH